MSVGDPFDLEAGMFEIEEQRGFEAGDVEVAQHLGEVVFVESSDDLGIDDDGFVDDEIGDEVADELAVVVDGVLLLLVTNEALFGEFDDEGTFVEFFIEARLEGVENLHGRADDEFGELFVVGEHGWRFLTTDGTDGHGRMKRIGLDNS